MATVSGELVGWRLNRKTVRRSAVDIAVAFTIKEGGVPVTPRPYVVTFSHPPQLFRGMSAQAIRTMLVEDGASGLPPLRDIAQGLLQDWEDATVLRSIELPLEFGP